MRPQSAQSRRLRRAAEILACTTILLASGPVEAELAAVAVCGQQDGDQREDLRARLRGELSARGVPLLDTEAEAFLFSSQPKPTLEPPIQKAARALKRARRSFRSFKLDAAQRHIQEMETAIQPWLGRPEARTLDRDRLVLSVSIGHALRDQDRVERDVRELAQRFGVDGLPKRSGWPPAIVEQFNSLTRAGGSVLSIATHPDGAAFVDGREVGRTPVTVADLQAGDHRVVVERDGYLPIDAQVYTAAGQPSTFEQRMAPRLAPVLERLDLDAPAPQEMQNLVRETAGEHLSTLFITCPSPSGVPRIRRVDLGGDSPSEVDYVTLADEGDESFKTALDRLLTGLDLSVASSGGGSGLPTWSYVTGGAGAVLIASGVLLRVLASSDQSDFEARASALTQSEAFEIRDSAESKARAGTVLITSGLIALAGTGVVLFVESLE